MSAIAQRSATLQPDLTYIWRKDARSGRWIFARDSLPQNVDAWLKVLRSTEPNVEFMANRRRPAPTAQSAT